MRIRNYLPFVLLLMTIVNVSAQTGTPFKQRSNSTNSKLRGNIKLVGNTILGHTLTQPTFDASGNVTNLAALTNEANQPTANGATGINDNVNMEYIDIDGDNTTFNSSSADLDIDPNTITCKRIIYAGLYWAASYPYERSTNGATEWDAFPAGSPRNTDWNQIKFKIPGGTYQTIVADNAADPTGFEDEIIFDGYNSTTLSSSFKTAPYVCYSDVTKSLQTLADANGTYTVANMRAARGRRLDGSSAGWALIIIYESPNVVPRFFSVYDGLERITGNHELTIPLTGFITNLTGKVVANVGVAALDGDREKGNDRYQFTSTGPFTNMSDSFNAATNFFDSSLTDNNAIVNAVNPIKKNTYGYDLDQVTLPNPSNSVLAQGVTSATIKMTTLGSAEDVFYPFVATFAVDNFVPEVSLTKTVNSLTNVNIDGQPLAICTNFKYIVGFHNTGSDDAMGVAPDTNFIIIRDVLPANVTFVSVNLSSIPGATYTYSGGSGGTLLVSIPKSYFEVGDPRYTFEIFVRTACTCDEVSDACANLIRNQAFITYQGESGSPIITNDPSSSVFDINCNLGNASATNSTILPTCTFVTNVALCANNPVTLTAANGYSTYVWSGPGTITPVAGTNNQSVTVTQVGVYTVNCTSTIPGCPSIVQTFNVIDNGSGAATNPVIPYADAVVICPNDGVQLPLIYLCGAGDHTLIQSNIAGATSMTWQQLNLGGACTAVVNPNCANTSAACNTNWTTVGTGPNYDATTAGEFRVIIDFNGCSRIFYFNVFQNTLNPIATPRDVICTTQGQITITNVPAGYEYQLNCTGAWQASNLFTGLPAGVYSVCIRQIGVTGACVFTLTDIPIVNRVFSVTATITQPVCSTDKGTIILGANGVLPQYTFTINQQPSNALIGTAGPQNGNTATFSGLNPGNYTYTVTTQDGCIQTTPFTIIQPSAVTAIAALTKPLACTAGEITVYPSGGLAPYIYVVTGAVTVTQTNPVISAPVAGTYNIQVVDANNCFVNVSITVAVTPPPVFTVSHTDVVCSTPADSGSITITVSNANGNSLMYSIDNGVTFFASNVFNNLIAGTYNVVVQYTFGTSVCTTVPQAVTIIGATPIFGISTLTTPYTCTTNGVITVSGVGGGTGPYTYSINGVTYQVGTTFIITGPGTYTVTIRDFKGCTFATIPIVVAPLTPPTDMSFVSTPLTCPSNTSNVTITTTGGSPALSYQIVLPFVGASQSSNVFNNLAPGTYTFEVTDSKNCKYRENFTISPLPVLSVIGTLITNISCLGSSTGSVSFTVSGSTGFTYTINGVAQGAGVSPITLTNQPAGNYTIVVTNTATNCTATATVTIAAPALALSATIVTTPVNCVPSNNGSVTITASGGWGGYSYSIFPNVGTLSGSTFSNLPAGTYTVTTTDSGGCQFTNTFTLVAPTPPTASIDLTASNFCYSSPAGATIVVTASGGIAPYTYNINGGPFQVSNVFSNLTPGSYTIIVRDNFGCTVTLPVQTIAPQLAVTMVFTKDLDCTASPSAVFTATSITGGYPAYSYQVIFNTVLNPTVFPIVGSTFAYSTLVPGTYQFLITDSRGCTVLSPVYTVNALVPVAATHTQINNLCFGDAAGSVTITPSGGVPAYLIQWNGAGPFTSTVTYSGLAAGTYTYIVRDTKFCTFNGSVTITAPTQIAYTAVVNPIACNVVGGYTLGSICVNGLSGGVAPYTYTLDFLTNGNPNQTHVDATGADFCFPNLDLGSYNLSVTDANGCTIVKSNLVISNPPSDLTFVVTPTIATCAAGATVTVTVVGGTGPFEFGILNAPPPVYAIPFVPANNPPTTHVFSGLTTGAIYTFVVRDLTTGCYYFEQMTAPTPTNSTLNVTSLVATPVTCRGAANGTVSFGLGGINAGATSINYVINYASNNMPVGTPGTSGTLLPAFTFPVTAGPLAPGTYNIYFTEIGGPNSGCGITSNTFTIVESATALTLSATTTNDNCNASAGHIAANAAGGTGPYLYQFLAWAPLAPPAPTATLPGAWNAASTFNGESGTYDVYVRDAYGCIVKVTVSIALDPTPIITATLVDACVAQGTYQIRVDMPTTGVAPYTFSIDGGAFVTNTTPFFISGLSSGVHTVQVRDKNGCGNTVSVTILPPLVVSAAFSLQPTCTNADGEITVTATGGSGNYVYTLLTPPSTVVQGPQASNVFAGFAATPAGYIIRVRDLTTNCIVEIPFNPTPATPVSFGATPTPVTCNGGSDGTITINLGAGNNNPVYTYQITSPFIGVIQNSNVFTGLPAGTYSVQVVSGRDCRLTLSGIIIGTPTAVVANGSATPFECNPDNTVDVSVITVTGAGGTPAYTYSIDGINYFTTNTFNIIDNGSTQNFTVYVKDLKGCIDTFGPVTISPLPTITNVTATGFPTITCNNPELVTLTVTGGSGNFTYQVLPSGAANVTQIGTTNQFNISAPGTYYFQVTDTTTLCTFAVAPYTVAPFNNLDVVLTATAPVTCFLGSDGALSMNVTGYSGAYTYTIYDSLGNQVLPIDRPGNTATNPQPIVGLSGGSYTVQVTETATPFCVKVSNVATIASPSEALTLTAIQTAPVTCTNDQGVISANATGGWGSYVYTILPGLPAGAVQTGGVFSSMPAGAYTIEVRDLLGCPASAPVTLILPSPITANVNATPAALLCNGDTTSINISNVNGGQGSNYNYTIKGPLPSTVASGPFPLPASGTVTISGITVGNYDVEIRDGWNCLSNFPVAITEPTIVTANLVLTTILTCTPNTGSVTLTGSGGTPPYSYSATGTAGSFIGSFNPSITISGLGAGTYSYYIQDANGCISTVSGSVEIKTPETLTLTLVSQQDINCYGDTTGAINVSAQGGLGNYQYTILNTTTGITTGPQPSGNFANLPYGDYQVSVVSGDCVVAPLSVTLTQPTAPFDVSLFSITGATCFGNLDGEIVLRITGYVGPLTYVITTSTAIPPVYNSQTIQLPVTQTPPVTVPPTPFDPLVWYATISNLAPNTVSSPPGVTPVVYSNWYSILLQNGPLGCSDELRNLTITRPEPLLAGVLPSATQNVQCFGEANGSFTVVGLDLSGNPIVNNPISGGTPAYQITLNYVFHYDNSVPPVFIDDSVYTSLNNGVGGLVPGTHVYQNLPAGTYSGAVKDQQGCVQQFTQVIADGPNFDPRVDSECILNARQYTVNVNSTPPNQVATYSLDGAAYNSTNTYYVGPGGISPGPHHVDVRIGNCTHGYDFNVVAPIVLTVANGGLNEIIASSTGGSGGNSYTFNGYDNGTNSYIITETGVYLVRVTDSDGCYDELSFPKTFVPIKIINVYTPGDGGGWSPLNTANYPKLMTRIYDRYGRMVAELAEGQKWYGKYKDQELPSGDYWYVIKVDESNSDEYVGHFTLYR